MISDIRPDIQWGDAAEELVALATASADRLMHKLLIDSIALWGTTGFDRYNDYEVSFSIRLYACMLAVKQAHRKEMTLMHLQYDGPLPSRNILLGKEDPATSPRPDMTVKCGDASIYTEAKLLALSGTYPSDYVNKGMMRFIDGRYTSSGINIALMLGYIIKEVSDECYNAVNGVIASDSRFKDAELVSGLGEPDGNVTIYRSTHDFGEMMHYAIDVRTRAAPTQQVQPPRKPRRNRRASPD